MKRAVASVGLNIVEGNQRTGEKDRARFFAIARSSAAEASAVIDIALSYRLIKGEDALFFHDILLQIVKMLWKLR